MLRLLKFTIALTATLLVFAATAPQSSAGWGHHHHGWGHGQHHGQHLGHYHGGYGGFYGGGLYGSGLNGGGLYRSSFYGSGLYSSGLNSGYLNSGYLNGGYLNSGLGWGGYGYGSSYSSLSINIGLPRYRSVYSNYGYYPSYSSYGLASGYYAPPNFVYRPSLPAYYAPTSFYSAPSYYGPLNYAPLNCPTCDPCISAPVVNCPTCDPNSAITPDANYPAPMNSVPPAPTAAYPTSTQPHRVPSSILTRSGSSGRSMTAGGSLVDRMLGRVQSSNVSVNSLASRVPVAAPDRRPSAAGSLRTVSTAAEPAIAGYASADASGEMKPLPLGMLKSADEIVSAGRFREAAAAYAHLTVHYGNHAELAARRFVSLVASGDCAQAAVLFELASTAEQPLLVSALPLGGLAELYGTQADARHSHINYLADYALKHPHDGLALAMVGTWLEMDGQPERAQPFLESARRSAAGSRSPAKVPAIAPRLVATDAAR